MPHPAPETRALFCTLSGNHVRSGPTRGGWKNGPVVATPGAIGCPACHRIGRAAGLGPPVWSRSLGVLGLRALAGKQRRRHGPAIGGAANMVGAFRRRRARLRLLALVGRGDRRRGRPEESAAAVLWRRLPVCQAVRGRVLCVTGSWVGPASVWVCVCSEQRGAFFFVGGSIGGLSECSFGVRGRRASVGTPSSNWARILHTGLPARPETDPCCAWFMTARALKPGRLDAWDYLVGPGLSRSVAGTDGQRPPQGSNPPARFFAGRPGAHRGCPPTPYPGALPDRAAAGLARWPSRGMAGGGPCSSAATNRD